MAYLKLLLAAVLLALAIAPAAAFAVPLPEDDPFFAVPGQGELAEFRKGEILDSRPVDVSALGLPIPADAWQVKYRTTDVHDDLSAYVTTVMIPDAPWTGKGPRPLVSYQTAEDGVSTKCAPSYGLRAGLESGVTNSSAEMLAMAVALSRGWAVAAPDHEGPRSEWLGAKGAARGVLDGIRAALAFEPAGLERGSTPVALWGYSGGALASTLAAQMQPRYARNLELAGIALGGVAADVRASMNAFSGSPFGGAIAIGMIGLHRSYPQFDMPSYLNEFGRRALVEAGDDCINDAVRRYPFARIEDFLADPAALASPEAESLFRRTSPVTFRGTPETPVYMYHSVFDELAPIAPARRLARRFCDAGVPVKLYEDVLSEHVTLVVTGYLGALGYLADRFAGRPAPSNC